MTGVIVVAAVLLAPILLFAVAGVQRRRYQIERNYSRTDWVTTDDGWRLALHRYPPETPRPDGARVLIVHGFSGSSKDLDLSDRQSVPLFLAARGYDVWTLDLRGCGLSETRTRLDRLRWRYTYDDHWQKDVPAAVRHLESLGDGPLHYVGHSMGGLIGYSYLSTGGQARVRSMVALAPPASFAHVTLPVYGTLSALAVVLPGLLASTLARALCFRFESNPRLVRVLGIEPGNMYPGDYRAVASGLVNNMPLPIVVQFNRWARAERTGRGVPAYMQTLGDLTIPTVVVVGEADATAPVDSVRAGYEALGSADKRWVLAGPSSGFTTAYNHFDLVAGRTAREEIYPLVADWLAAHP